MSKANQRRLASYHEAGHAVMAWLEGVTINEMRLVSDDEPGQYSATTMTQCPGSNPENWSLADLMAHIRITLAGPEAEKRGPHPTTAHERNFLQWEAHQHRLTTIQFAKQCGDGLVAEEDVPIMLASAEQDVREVFEQGCVIRCVEALASQLLRHGTLVGADVESFIASKIFERERETIRKSCCVTCANTGSSVVL